MSWPGPIDAALYLTIGMIIGTVYFVLLLRTVRLHSCNAAATHIMPLYLLRFATAITAFWFVAQQGALPLLLTLTGFLAARVGVQRWMGPG
jgi:F1F0 ATPase subunit 2